MATLIISPCCSLRGGLWEVQDLSPLLVYMSSSVSRLWGGLAAAKPHSSNIYLLVFIVWITQAAPGMVSGRVLG